MQAQADRVAIAFQVNMAQCLVILEERLEADEALILFRFDRGQQQWNVKF